MAGLRTLALCGVLLVATPSFSWAEPPAGDELARESDARIEPISASALLVYPSPSAKQTPQPGQDKDATRAPDPQSYFAFAVRASEPAGASQASMPVDLTIVADVSARNGGPTLQVIKSYLQTVAQDVPSSSRLSVQETTASKPAILDAGTRSPEWTQFTRQFDPAPVGLAAIPQAIEKAAKALQGGSLSQRVLVYVGSAGAGMNPWTADELQRLRDQLLRERIVFFAILVSPTGERAGELATLAAVTGGRTFLVDPTATLADRHRLFESAARAMTLPVSRLTWDANANGGHPQNLLPRQLPPLRPDQWTLIAGSAGATPDPSSLQAWFQSSEGKPVSLELPTGVVLSPENAFIKQLAVDWSQSPDQPSLRDATTTLTAARKMVQVRAVQLVGRAEQASARGDSDQAESLLKQATALDPELAQATANKTDRPDQPEQSDRGAQKAAKISAETRAEETALQLARAREQVEIQRLDRQMRQALAQAKQIGKRDPAAASAMLKQALLAIDSAAIPKDRIQSWKRRIETELRYYWRQNQAHQQAQLAAAQQAAAAAGVREADEKERRQQVTAKELMEQYRHLLGEGEFAAAGALANTLANEQPDNVAAAAARAQGELARRVAIDNDIQAETAEGWWEQVTSARASAIPMASNVRFPDAREWERLSLARAKYRDGIDISDENESEKRIRESLQRPITFDFQETPLSDVIAFLRDYTGNNIVLDENALDAAGVSLDTPVTLQLEQVSLKSALNLMLRPMELGYLITDEVLLITSREQAENKLVTKVYPVADLVYPILDFNSASIGQGAAAGSLGSGSGGSGGGGGMGGGFLSTGGGIGTIASGPGQSNSSPNRTAAAIQFEQLIKSAVGHPDQWDTSGGPGTIVPFGDKMVVTAPAANLPANTAGKAPGNANSGQDPAAPNAPLARPAAHAPAKGASQEGQGANQGAGQGASDQRLPARQVWSRFFETNPITSAAVRRSVAQLASHGQHRQVVALLEGWLTHRPGEDWMYPAMALSLQLAGESEERVQAALMALVDRNPRSLETRLEVAERLSALGYPRAALDLLTASADLYPHSAALLAAIFDTADEVEDTDRLVWAADRLYASHWPGEEAFRTQMDADVVRRIAVLRGEGDVHSADRLTAVRDQGRERDLSIEVHWAGDADIDLYVVEPGDILCSPLTPCTINGGVFTRADGQQSESYIASQATPGTYEVLLRPVWGTPAGGIVNVDIRQYAGTPQEKVTRHTVNLAKMQPLRIDLDKGRRTEPAIWQANEMALPARGGAPSTISPFQQLCRLVENGRLGREGSEPPARNPLEPTPGFAPAITGVGAVAFDPVITVYNSGTSLQAQAVISPDRRYVRLQMAPVLQDVQSFRTIYTQGVSR